mmetsp:Transcript_17626/g.45609  ORF Transcript_17626/g.45609 Transcript_17626/m.45609 type:complete len:84 (+) Transcript_17626:35-286(+)
MDLRTCPVTPRSSQERQENKTSKPMKKHQKKNCKLLRRIETKIVQASVQMLREATRKKLPDGPGAEQPNATRSLHHHLKAWHA